MTYGNVRKPSKFADNLKSVLWYNQSRKEADAMEPFFQSNRRSQREKLVRRCTVALVISGILFIAVAVGACLYLQGPSLIG